MSNQETNVLSLSISKERQTLLDSLRDKYNPEGSILRRYQLSLLDILKEFDMFCKRNDIKYFLGYGTLLGAVRHHGFIPWDDDADICMDRENYTKLENILQGEKLSDNLCVRREIFRPILYSPLYKTPFAFIDIFIIDSCPNSNLHAKIKELATRWVYVMVQLERRLKSKRKFEHYKKLIPLLPFAMILTEDKWLDIYRKIPQWFTQESSTTYSTRRIQCYNETMSGLKRKYPTSAFVGTLYTCFEGYLFPIPKGYDDVLCICYGDYMSLPQDRCRRIHGRVANAN